jgi:tight adherence protein C
MMPDKLTLVASVMVGVVVLVGLSALLLIQEARRRDLESRIVRTVWGRQESKPAFSGLVGRLHALGERVQRGRLFYSDSDLENLQGIIAAAGFNPRRALPLLLGIKIALLIVMPTIGLILALFLLDSLRMRYVMVAVALCVGIYGPNLILSILRRSYQAALQRGAPDALDLLVVCSEAGMGLESALERVSQEMIRSNRPTAIALLGLLNDLRVLPDRREAFRNLGRRSGVEGLQRLAMMLSQALQFGTPLGQALRAVAAELRRDRASKLEEKAVKLPSKLLFPLVLFIMPSIFIVLSGSTFLRLLDTLSKVSIHAPASPPRPPPPHR